MTDEPQSVMLTEDQAQAMADELTRGGVPPEKVAQHLAELGLQVPSASPRAIAQAEMVRLKADPAWVAKFNDGDVEAGEAFNRLTAAIAMNEAEAKTYRPDEYSALGGYRATLAAGGEEAADAFRATASEFAQELEMSPDLADAILQHGFDALDADARLTDEASEARAEANERLLLSVLGNHVQDAQARMAAAQKVLDGTTAQTSLREVARHSPDAALLLLQHIEALAARKGRNT